MFNLIGADQWSETSLDKTLVSAFDQFEADPNLGARKLSKSA